VSFQEVYLEATKYTPKVILKKGYFAIIGDSFPEDSFAFYETIINSLKQYPSKTILVVDIQINYMNSGSLKILFDIFDIFENLKTEGVDIVINWQYEDDNEIIKEIIEDFIEEFVDLQINWIKEK